MYLLLYISSVLGILDFGLETESIIMPIAYRCKCRNIDELWRGPPTFRKWVVAPLLVTQVLLHLPSLFTILTYKSR